MLERLELQWLLSFQSVYRQLSFKLAAEERQIPKSNISRHIAQLEAQLGLRLFERTTRKMVETEAGKALYESLCPLLASMEDSFEALSQQNEHITGHLKVSTPDLPFFANIFTEFCRQHPKIHFSCETQLNPQEDMTDGFDVVLCFGRGNLDDSNWVSRELARWPSVVVASPCLLQQLSYPSKVSELVDLPCITTLSVLKGQPWRFKNNQVINVQSSFRVNSGHMAKAAALKGLGFAILPLHACKDELNNGTLLQVCLDEEPEDLTLNALYAGRYYPKRKVSVFIEHVLTEIDELHSSNPQ